MQKETITDPWMDLEQVLHELEFLADTFNALDMLFEDRGDEMPECALTMPVTMLLEKVKLANAAFADLMYPPKKELKTEEIDIHGSVLDQLTEHEIRMLIAYRKADNVFRDSVDKLLFTGGSDV